MDSPASTADAAVANAADADDSAPVSRPMPTVKSWEIGLVAAFALLLYIPMLGSYNLWDPWETHYGEVARRMLQDDDWIRMKWQHENFRSKPILTFWLMAGSMKLLGVADDGGYSGEFVASDAPQWALRLPFALFGVMGIVVLWWAVARLYSKRAAWLASIILATCPYYFFISRQAITDMPSCALFIAAMALFAVAWLEEPRQLHADWKKRTPLFVFLGAFTLLGLGQILAFLPQVARDRWMLGPQTAIPGWLMMSFFIIPFAAVAVWIFFRTRTMRQIYWYWFFLLNGLAILAKGPISPVLSALTIAVFWAMTINWKKPDTDVAVDTAITFFKGFLVMMVIALPWHFAIYLKDGNAWLNEYVNQHLFGRAFRGVHGDRGTFDYFLSQLGVGMWPWIALVPAALVSMLVVGRAKSREAKLRLLVAIWAIVGFTFFSAIQTKFHHYILPAVPAFAALVAFWLDDLLDGRVPAAHVGLAIALPLFFVTSLDLVTKQERLVHLFIYRYDRPWPYAKPWNLDFTWSLLIIAGVIGVFLALLFMQKLRRWAAAGLCAGGIIFAYFSIDVLLVAASPHWGQKPLHEVYYKNRVIHGIDLIYYGTNEIADDWKSGKDIPVRSMIPTTLQVGDPMKVTWELRAKNETVRQKGELAGRVSRIDRGGDRFFIEIPPGERDKLKALVDEGRRSPSSGRKRWLAVNADRLVAWQLNWRGENLYSGGEIWDPKITDAQTVFMDTDNKKFLEYLKPRIGQGRTFWVVTEKQRLNNLANVLPTETAKKSVETTTLDNSSNKFGLARFQLDEGRGENVVTPSSPLPTEEVDTGGGL